MRLEATATGVVLRVRSGVWRWSIAEIAVDRQGVSLDGERLPVETTFHLDERRLVLDSRFRRDVLGHDIPFARLDEVREVIERAILAARHAHGEGPDDVPVSLGRLR
ncbi:MAG: hypothetical protein H6734_26205 [Alphaproteobacteria bacterium]|nr:hypothetical protein [Alphaproteobacteria bacterium]MCB9672990.1 hypothetical protein [Alphaproteobacteria bacterium]